MTLSLAKLLDGVSGVTLNQLEALASDDLMVSSMTLDSRAVASGTLFVALQGLTVHGLAYAEAAESAGAVAILWDNAEGVNTPELSIPVIGINDLPASLGGIAARLYDYSSQQLQIVGITGTDGKTSVSHFLAQAMNASGESCSVIGTLGIGNPSALEKATHTTPDVISVHRNLHRLSTRGSRCVAMEVSSHALDQQRVAGVDFDVAVLTNLTRDHLDYHGTVAAYADAKAKLFLAHQPKAAVLNLNDAFGVRLVEAIAGSESSALIYAYVIEDVKVSNAEYPAHTLIARNATFFHEGIRADIEYKGEHYQLSASVLADFNLSNLLATAASLIALGYEPVKAITLMSEVQTVPGRIENVQQLESQAFLTVVDYAHTPAALESVLKALRIHTEGRLICVFGCGGDRDAGKRPLMAEVAERLADAVIVTDDNPRSEDPAQIMADIEKGFINSGAVVIEHDRAAAIRQAVELACKGDVVLVAGKGHEPYQLVGDESLVFDDREQLRSALDALAERAVA